MSLKRILGLGEYQVFKDNLRCKIRSGVYEKILGLEEYQEFKEHLRFWKISGV